MNRRKFIGVASVATAVTATGVSVTACNSNTSCELKAGEILHTVAFSLKHEAESEASNRFLADGKQILSAIPVVKNFQVFRQTSPKCDFHFGFSMVFKNRKDFETYNNIKNFSMLMMTFRNKEQKNFVRLINFLNKRVVTLSLTPESFSCENVLAAARVVVVDSIPPFADVYINDRKIGEAPVWTSLDDGTDEVQC